jgi:PAS domain S-box-containing protein
VKPNIQPRNHEIQLADDEFIVSKTDRKGRITYCNRVFMKIAGDSEKELLHAQHNILRHPDMPRGAFRLLWQTLEQGQEFFAYVKNLTSDGSYYWVFANVTPDYDSQGQLKGYFSVRRKPRDSAIKIIEPIYQEMLKLEQEVGPKLAPDASIALLNEKLDSLNTSYEKLILSI